MKNSYSACIFAGAAGAVVATVAPLLLSTSSAQTQLLPFQGRLTDAAGNAVGDGARVVEFKLYDAPTGGNVKWAGEVHRLSVNGGLVNTMLGSKASLGSVDFATATFLQITVDANNDGAITAADPPLLPRQSVVGAVYAAVAGGIQYAATNGVAAVDGRTLFDDSGKLKTTNLAGDNGITAEQLAAGSVGTSELEAGSVTAAKLNGDVAASLLVQDSVTSMQIKDGEVKTGEIADGAVTMAKLAGSVAGGVETIAGAVTSEKIRDGTILGRDVAVTSISPEHLNHQFVILHERRQYNESIPSVAGWQRRLLNRTVEGRLPGVALNADGSFSLPPGEFYVRASAPAYICSSHQLVLRRGLLATGEVMLLGTTQYSPANSGANVTCSEISGSIRVTDNPQTFSLQHFIQVANPVHGLGLGNTQGTSGGSQANQEESVFTILEIWRLK